LHRDDGPGPEGDPSRDVAFSGQNFAKASGIQFVSRENKQEYAWTTSWGVSTRLIGTVIMAHGDDDGCILPPRISPSQIVILPVTPKPDTRAAVLEACEKLAVQLREQRLQAIHCAWRSIPRRGRWNQELGLDQARSASAG
jgi:prolyl-tRNA synthetase